MPRASFIDKPKRWRQRAEKTRTLAEQMEDGVSRHMMYHIADDYERLAVRAALRAKSANQLPLSEPTRPKSGRVRSGRAGGIARAKKLSSEDRRAIAKKAAAAKWSK
jgi:hypothetical protein